MRGDLVLWMAALWISTMSTQIPKFGLYKWALKEVTPCFSSGTEEIKITEMSLRKTSRTAHLVSMRFTSNITIDDNVNVRFNFAFWSNAGGWKQNSLTYDRGPFCQALEVISSSWGGEGLSQVREQLNLTTACPLAAPSSFLLKLHFDQEKLNSFNEHSRITLPKLVYGLYKLEIMCLKGGELKDWTVSACFPVVMFSFVILQRTRLLRTVKFE